MTTILLREGRIALGAGLGAAALVAGALGFQFLGGYAPCEMCHWQRWPHIAAALIAIMGTQVWKWDMRLLTLPVILLTALLGIALTGQAVMAPYIAACALGLAALAWFAPGMRGLVIICLVLIAVSGLIGAYQSGMQWGFLPGPSACTGKRFIMGSDMVPEIQCDVVTWSLFGLSMATYNAIISLLIAALGAAALVKDKHVP